MLIIRRLYSCPIRTLVRSSHSLSSRITSTQPSPSQQRALAKYLDYFNRSNWIKQKCLAMGVEHKLLETALIDYKESLLSDSVKGLSLADAIAHIEANSKMDKVLLPAFYTFLADRYPQKVQLLRSLMSFSDLTSPADWHSAARSMKRKIIMHVGPTNSGKTYAALQRLEQCATGIYCGPLRLLAHEVYERLNSKGVPCNLLTGEERRESDGVFKWAATVEMAPVTRKFNVAVLDEIQMIGDRNRGWAWTQALLGLQADEIHVCGEPTAVPLVQAMAKETGDYVQINTYKRLTGLTVKGAGLGGKLTELKRGDCVVTFSRQNIFAVKRQIEEKTQLRAAVIYGSLPPETRAEQAKLFNDPKSVYDVLVASDAIGMGLNLNIGRMIFERVEKWDGMRTKSLTVSEIKQIAGRAGRFGTQYENGEVCTLDDYDMHTLRRAMKVKAPNVMSAGLHPTLEQIESFSKYLPNVPLASLLDRFEDLASLGGRYFLCNLDSQRAIANIIAAVPLTLRDRYIFLLAPCNVKDTLLASRMLTFAKSHASGTECPLEPHISLPTHAPDTIEALRDLEAQHRVIILYMWLSQRFAETFTDVSGANVLKRKCERLINTGLAELSFERRRKKSKPRNRLGDDARVETVDTQTPFSSPSQSDVNQGILDLLPQNKHSRPGVGKKRRSTETVIVNFLKKTLERPTKSEGSEERY
ncbi:hypothetical protein SpCBS45565_g08176 [Spizellomyces sp. 'palustris']|nr:hypothetical protein SpCBS45565_g08176 [Spizellomyces sp. 'palustris']